MLTGVNSNEDSGLENGAGAANHTDKLFESYTSGERMLLDAYELTFDKRTNEASIIPIPRITSAFRGSKPISAYPTGTTPRKTGHHTKGKEAQR